MEEWALYRRFSLIIDIVLLFIALLLTLRPVASSTQIALQTWEQRLDGPRHLFGTLPAKIGAFPELAEQRMIMAAYLLWPYYRYDIPIYSHTLSK